MAQGLAGGVRGAARGERVSKDYILRLIDAQLSANESWIFYNIVQIKPSEKTNYPRSFFLFGEFKDNIILFLFLSFYS